MPLYDKYYGIRASWYVLAWKRSYCVTIEFLVKVNFWRFTFDLSIWALIQVGSWLNFGCILGEKRRNWRHSHKNWLLVNKFNHERLTFYWQSHVDLFIDSWLLSTFFWMHYYFNWIKALKDDSKFKFKKEGNFLHLLEKQVTHTSHYKIQSQVNFKYYLELYIFFSTIDFWLTIDHSPLTDFDF